MQFPVLMGPESDLELIHGRGSDAVSGLLISGANRARLANKMLRARNTSANESTSACTRTMRATA